MLTGYDFGNVDGLVTGTVWNDADGDRLRGGDEAGLAGVRVYADKNLNGQYDAGEPNATSADDGSYRLALADGVYCLRETVPDGWQQTTPADGFYEITLLTGLTISGRDFGNQAVSTAAGSLATPGLYDPAASVWYLRDSATTGMADHVFGYGEPGAGWTPVVGDWNADGADTVGLYDPQASTWYLRNANSSGAADDAFGYGPAAAGWIAVVGDWNGDGTDTVGLYDPGASTWYLRNTNTAGTAQIVFGFGEPGAGWTPVVGDWNGDGIDTVGLYDSASAVWYLRQANSTAEPDAVFGYGQPGAAWSPVVGDWNAAAGDSIGLVDTACVWLQRNSNTSGSAEAAFGYGSPGAGWTPLAGHWGAAGAALVADASAVDTAVGASTLSADQLPPLLAEAVRRYAAAGLDAARLAALNDARVVVTDLPGAMLGWATRDTIYVDLNAAGHGWFVDRTPAVDEEFTALGGGGRQAIDPAAVDRIDLVTVVEHELGHVAGLSDVAVADRLMCASLPTGLRRSVAAADLE
jgi:hypothetical protein